MQTHEVPCAGCKHIEVLGTRKSLALGDQLRKPMEPIFGFKFELPL